MITDVAGQTLRAFMSRTRSPPAVADVQACCLSHHPATAGGPQRRSRGA